MSLEIWAKLIRRGHTKRVAPKRLLTSSARHILRVRLCAKPHTGTTHHRLDIHTLLEKGTVLRLSTMHVLVEESSMKDAPLWIETAMAAAYAGELFPTYWS